jgi:hypothetical protein
MLQVLLQVWCQVLCTCGLNENMNVAFGLCFILVHFNLFVCEVVTFSVMFVVNCRTYFFHRKTIVLHTQIQN